MTGPIGRVARTSTGHPARRSAGRAGRGHGVRWWSSRSGLPVPDGRGGFFDPPRLVVCSRQVRAGQMWAATVCVTGYPQEVGAGWLAPLTGHPGLVDVSVHVAPVDPAVSASRLRRRLARLESGRRSNAEHGRLTDPDVEAAAEDAHLLAEQIARGATKLFEVTVTITVHAPTRAELADELAAVQAVAASLLIAARPTTWRALHGWFTGLPAGIDRIGTARILDTAALAASFPFTSPDLPVTQPPTDPIDPDDLADADGGSGAGAVLYGRNLGSSSLVFWDRWHTDRHSQNNAAAHGGAHLGAVNHNSVVLATSGAGKSYLVKSELLRQLHTGVHAHVIDPEDEYVRLADAVGGTVVRAGAPGVRINPFDLPVHVDVATGRRSVAPDALTRRRLFLQSFLAVALTTGDPADPAGGTATGSTGATNPGPGGVGLTALERSVLDAAISRTYTRAGITDDPRTWARRAPLLTDLHHALLSPHDDRPVDATTPASSPPASSTPASSPPRSSAPGADETAFGADERSGPADDAPCPVTTGTDGSDPMGAVAVGLAARLAPFTEGAYAHLFNGPTTTVAAGHLVVWSVRELPEQIRPLGMLLVLDAIWRTVTHPHDRRPRLIVVDEAWLLLAHRAAAGFLLRAAKSCRKYWAGLTVVTQDVADVLGSDLGRAVVTNSATAILLRQSAQAIPELGRVFALSTGESRFLLSADRGDALLISGQDRVAFSAVTSPTEDALITTDPAQLAATHAADPDWISLDRGETRDPHGARDPLGAYGEPSGAGW